MPSSMGAKGPLDGDGILFVAHDAKAFPGAFLPVPLGNVGGDQLREIYRGNELLQRIRARRLEGICGPASSGRSAGAAGPGPTLTRGTPWPRTPPACW